MTARSGRRATKAVIACESCGRFLCTLCDLEFGGRHICPNCLSAGRKKGALGNYDHFRLSWSGVALTLAIVPAVAFIGFAPFNLAFGLVAIVVAFIGLKKPRSLTGRRRVVSFTLAVLLGQQADTLGAEQPCPDCGRPCTVHRADRPLTFHGGQLTHSEPLGHCPDCRRDFFPPTAAAAPGRPRLQPRRAADDR